MRDLIKEYVGYLQVEKGLSLNTLNSYLRDLQSLEAYAREAGKCIEGLTKDDLVGWIKGQSLKGAAASSISRRVSSVRGFYRYLLRDGFIKTDLNTELLSPPFQRKIPTYLEISEMDALVCLPDVATHLGRRDRAMIELLYATGLRVSELVNLRLSDVSLDRALLTCRGKGSKQRWIPLGRSAVASLREYLNIRSLLLGECASEALFVRANKGLMSRQQIWSLLRKYAKRAGLQQVTPHNIRHTFASHLVQRGADSRAVQALLGHSDLSTTQIYTHVSKQHLADTLEQFHPRGGVKSRDKSRVR